MKRVFLKRCLVNYLDFDINRKDIREIMVSKYWSNYPIYKLLDTDYYFDNALHFSFKKDDTLSLLKLVYFFLF